MRIVLMSAAHTVLLLAGAAVGPSSFAGHFSFAEPVVKAEAYHPRFPGFVEMRVHIPVLADAVKFFGFEQVADVQAQRAFVLQSLLAEAGRQRSHGPGHNYAF